MKGGKGDSKPLLKKGFLENRKSDKCLLYPDGASAEGKDGDKGGTTRLCVSVNLCVCERECVCDFLCAIYHLCVCVRERVCV